MRNLEYRYPRSTAHFDIQFTFDGQTLRGHCCDVSQAGIRARFTTPTPIGACGVLTVEDATHTHSLKARVTYIQGADAGLAFIRDTAQDRGAARLFSAFLAARPAKDNQPSKILTFP